MENEYLNLNSPNKIASTGYAIGIYESILNANKKYGYFTIMTCTNKLKGFGTFLSRIFFNFNEKLSHYPPNK